MRSLPLRPATAVPPAAAAPHGPIGFRLADLNPLQYLPIVGTIYRAVTGEQIDPAWRIGGAVVTGALIAGPVGVVTSLIGVGLEELFHRVVGDAAPPATAVPDAGGPADRHSRPMRHAEMRREAWDE